MLELAASARDGRVPRAFGFRGVGLLFYEAVFSVHTADAEGGRLEFWTVDDQGRTTMTAKAGWWSLWHRLGRRRSPQGSWASGR